MYLLCLSPPLSLELDGRGPLTTTVKQEFTSRCPIGGCRTHCAQLPPQPSSSLPFCASAELKAQLPAPDGRFEGTGLRKFLSEKKGAKIWGSCPDRVSLLSLLTSPKSLSSNNLDQFYQFYQFYQLYFWGNGSMDKYPSELLAAPIPVVALMGQSRMQEPIKEILLASYQIKALAYDLTDPVAFASPPKRATYDNYVAKGILKANWMHKTVNVNASTVALLIPWCDKEGRDERGKPWHTREPDLLQAVNYILRNYQHLRNPHHIIFIILLAPDLVLAETSCVEKISLFRRKTELSERFFFVIPEEEISPGSLSG